MKTVHYKIMVSTRFPSDHPRKGQPTYFVEAIKLALGDFQDIHPHTIDQIEPKIHTIRKNYNMWVKRIKKVNEGKAVIDICYWKLPGGRYTPGNEAIAFATLDKNSGCGVQKAVKIHYVYENKEAIQINGFDHPYDLVAQNDGLTEADFRAWFRKTPLNEELALIHFTIQRY